MTERNLAFNLLRGALNGEAPHLGTNPIEANVWWSLFRMLQRNHVAALASLAIENLDMPREVMIPWLAEREKAERWHRYQREVQQDIVDTMARHGIETLVLKGTHTAQYYPVAELREFGDIDLYFTKHKEADAVAKRCMGVEPSNDSHHHTKYDYRGVTIESHYDFVNSHYPPSNRSYEKILKQLAPSPTFEILFLLRHMAVHFAASRITLRDVVDWHLTCRALNDKADWTLIQKTINGYGMGRFAAALCHITEHRFGNKTPLNFAVGPDSLQDAEMVEKDIILEHSATADNEKNGIDRLAWKMRRHRANRWKQRMVYGGDSAISLLVSSLLSHAMKPQSILHKM